MCLRRYKMFLILGVLSMGFQTQVYAKGKVTLDPITIKAPGEAINLSGQTALEKLMIKVINPEGKPIYYNSIQPEGKQYDCFALPKDSPSGVYTVIIGEKGNTVVGTFEVDETLRRNSIGEVTLWVDQAKRSVAIQGKISNPYAQVSLKVKNPEGEWERMDQVQSGEEGNFVFDFYTVDQSVGNYQVSLGGEGVQEAYETSFQYEKLKPIPPDPTDPPIGAGGTGGGNEQRVKDIVITQQTYQNLYQAAKGDETGQKVIQYEVKETSPTGYRFTLPQEAVASPKNKVKWCIKTPLGVIGLTNDSFKPFDTGKEPLTFKVRWDEVSVYVVSETEKALMDKGISVSIPYKLEATREEEARSIVAYSSQASGKLRPIVNSKWQDQQMRLHTREWGTFVIKSFEDPIKDFAQTHWARPAVRSLMARGIVKTSENFKPSEPIARGEFVRWLVEGLELTQSFEENFTDVEEQHTYYEAVGIARALGIVKGVGEESFKPQEALTREEMMVMTGRALEVKGGLVIKGDIPETYQDRLDVSPYARASLAALIEAGIIQGNDQQLYPKQWTTRAEAAVMIDQLIASRGE